MLVWLCHEEQISVQLYALCSRGLPCVTQIRTLHFLARRLFVAGWLPPNLAKYLCRGYCMTTQGKFVFASELPLFITTRRSCYFFASLMYTPYFKCQNCLIPMLVLFRHFPRFGALRRTALNLHDEILDPMIDHGAPH
jgi:hypothetical protein